jgi:peptidoglycan/LPS O-acetylase OafA/YrhL
MGETDRVASLDALRGSAAFAVAIAHYLAYRGIGPFHAEAVSALAVEIFFTLSGFVLAPQIVRCVRDGSLSTLRVFLIRRWMRTVPPYLVALAGVAVLFGQAGLADTLRYALYVQNLFAQHNAVDFFPVAWSLSVEEWFYVTFPALAMAVAALARRADLRTVAATAVLYIAAVTVLRYVAGDLATWGVEVRRVVAFRVDSIAYGVLLHLVLSSAGGRVRSGAAVAAAGLTALAAGALGLHTALLIGRDEAVAAKHLFPFVAAFFGIAGITFAAFAGPAMQRWAPVRELAYFGGRISYPVYLFHLPLMMVMPQWTAGLPIWAEFALYVASLTAFCALFHNVFEVPILAARPRYASARAADAPLSSEPSAPALTMGRV